MPHRRTARLARWQMWLLCTSLGALWLSGAVWLLLHYYGRVAGEFGPEANPWEAWMLRLHGLALIPALLGIGGLFLAHIPKGWSYRFQRVAGVALAMVLGLLVASGYLLYYVGDDHLRANVSLVHWTVGLCSALAFIWHYVSGRRARRR